MDKEQLIDTIIGLHKTNYSLHKRMRDLIKKNPSYDNGATLGYHNWAVEFQGLIVKGESGARQLLQDRSLEYLDSLTKKLTEVVEQNKTSLREAQLSVSTSNPS